MSSCENQQVTRSWFVGILEGEGSFRNTAKSNKEVRISNCDTDIIRGCENYLRANNIWATKGTGYRDGKKPEHTIRIANSRSQVFQYAELLYKLISPSMECRLDEYQRILGTPETTCDLSVDLDWMIGIFEAEGSFNLRLNHRGVANLKIDLPSTNRKIIQKVVLNLHAMGCSWHIRDKISDNPHHRDARVAEIHGMRRCRRFLAATNGMWVADRNQKRSSMMIQFIDSRFSHSQKDPYTTEELRYIQVVEDLNR